MFEEQIALGAALLDVEKPGWRDKIDVETLDMSNTWCCVLGQTFADETPQFSAPYWVAVDRLGIETDSWGRDENGMLADDYGFADEPEQRYELLTAEWIEYLSR